MSGGKSDSRLSLPSRECFMRSEEEFLQRSSSRERLPQLPNMSRRIDANFEILKV